MFNTLILVLFSLTWNVHGTAVSREKSEVTIWPLPASSRRTESSCGREYTLAGAQIIVERTERKSDLTQYVEAAFKLAKKSWNCGEFPSSVPYDIHVQVMEHETSLQNLISLSPFPSEAYTLQINSKGITIIADTIIGVQWAMSSLTGVAQGRCMLSCMPIGIEDKPRFRYRGLLLDTGRNYFPMSTLYELIDFMWSTKLNYLHWHISDSQSQPLEFLFADVLHAYANNTKAYLRKDVVAFTEYAWLRGIQIMPEFDMPGHMTTFKNFETLNACYDRQPWDGNGLPDGWALQPPSGQLKPTAQALLFAQNIVTELISLFPSMLYCSGCDEINYNCWNSAIVPRMINGSTENPEWSRIVDEFTEKLKIFQIGIAHVVRNPPAYRGGGGAPPRRLVVWDESFREYGFAGTAALPLHSILLVWKGTAQIPAMHAAGYDTVFVDHSRWYLDCGIGTNMTAHTSWCADPDTKSIHSWEKMYEADPMMFGGEEEKMLGGEAAMWTEGIVPSILSYVVNTRAAAVAERLWSEKNVRDLGFARLRLEQYRENILMKGLKQRSSPLNWSGTNFRYALRPEWCDTHIGSMSNGSDYCASAKEYAGKVELSFENLVIEENAEHQFRVVGDGDDDTVEHAIM